MILYPLTKGFKLAKSSTTIFSGAADVAIVRIDEDPIYVLNSYIKAVKVSLSFELGLIAKPHAVSFAAHGYSKSISKPSKVPGYYAIRATHDATKVFRADAVNINVWKAVE